MHKTFFVKTKTKTKTCVFVLEAPRDQDLGLEDYITGTDQIEVPAATGYSGH